MSPILRYTGWPGGVLAFLRRRDRTAVPLLPPVPMAGLSCPDSVAMFCAGDRTLNWDLPPPLARGTQDHSQSGNAMPIFSEGHLWHVSVGKAPPLHLHLGPTHPRGERRGPSRKQQQKTQYHTLLR